MPHYKSHKKAGDRKTRKFERNKAWEHNKSQGKRKMKRAEERGARPK